MGLENVLSKNPSINDVSQMAARQSDGVDHLYFNSDHSDSPVSGENGRYHEVDGKDRITIKGSEGEETVTAQEFVSDDRFSSFGDPQERLSLINKASKYEIPNGKELESADDLKAYVNSLKPFPAKTKPSLPPIAKGEKEFQELESKIGRVKANFQEAAKASELKAALTAKKDELGKVLEREASLSKRTVSLDDLQNMAKSFQTAPEACLKMNGEKFAQDIVKMTREQEQKTAIKTVYDWVSALIKY